VWIVRGEDGSDLGAFSTYERMYMEMTRAHPGVPWQQTGVNEYLLGTMTISKL
jgi:hypothetical protein